MIPLELLLALVLGATPPPAATTVTPAPASGSASTQATDTPGPQVPIVKVRPDRSPPASDAPASLALGASAPLATTRMKNVDGHLVTLAGAAGPRGTLVLFMCNHCPWVKMWQARIAAIGNAAMAESLGVVAIN